MANFKLRHVGCSLNLSELFMSQWIKVVLITAKQKVSVILVSLMSGVAQVQYCISFTLLNRTDQASNSQVETCAWMSPVLKFEYDMLTGQ